MADYISEGFFSQSQSTSRSKPLLSLDVYKKEIGEKLKNLSPLTDEEWDFVNTSMDGYVNVEIWEELHELCYYADKKYGHRVKLNWINTSSIINMSKMFFMMDEFNGDISKWDTSNVADMHEMFYECEKFNGDLSQWDVSHVKNMSSMFLDCKKFNGKICKWNVSSVTDMSNMFHDCKNFNQNLNSWDVSNVVSMVGMFNSCYRFNKPLDKWNVSNVKDMRYMFSNCRKFYQDLSTWELHNDVQWVGHYYDDNCDDVFPEPFDSTPMECEYEMQPN